MSTKKQPAADLPTTTPTAPAKPKRVRLSRPKAAIAERALAKAQAVGDYTAVNDTQAKLAAPAADLGAQAGAMIDEFSSALNDKLDDQGGAVTGLGKPNAEDILARFKAAAAGFVSRDEVLAEIETKLGLTPDDVEQLLVDHIDLEGGTDPFATDDPEAIAQLRLERGVQHQYAIPVSIAERLAAMNDDSALPMIEKEYALDEDCADGSTFVVVGSQAVIDLIDGFLPDEETRLESWEAAKTRLLNAQARKLEMDNEQRVPPDAATENIALDTYDIALEQYDRVLELEGEVATLKTALQAAVSRAETAEHDAQVNVGIIKRQDSRIGSLNAALQSVMKRGFFARLFNVPPVLPLSEPMKLDPSLLHKRRNGRSTTAG